jgi:hypothetical protein
VFQKGGGHLVTVLRHDAPPRKIAGVYRPSPAKPPIDVTLSMSARLSSIAPDRPAFLWRFTPRDPDQSLRRAGIQKLPHWDELFTSRTCSLLGAEKWKDRLEIKTTIAPELTTLFLVTQVPAVFCSVDGQPTNLLLPDMLGCRIESSSQPQPGGYAVRIRTSSPAEVLLYWPKGAGKAIVNGVEQPESSVVFGDITFVRVSVPRGETVAAVR